MSVLTHKNEETVRINIVKKLETIFEFDSLYFEQIHETGRDDIVLTSPYLAPVELKKLGEPLGTGSVAWKQGVRDCKARPGSKMFYTSNGDETFAWEPDGKPWLLDGEQLTEFVSEPFYSGFYHPTQNKTRDDFIEFFEGQLKKLAVRAGVDGKIAISEWADIYFAATLLDHNADIIPRGPRGGRVIIPQHLSTKNLLETKTAEELHHALSLGGIVQDFLGKKWAIFKNNELEINDPELVQELFKSVYEWNNDSGTISNQNVLSEAFESAMKWVFRVKGLGQYFTSPDTVAESVDNANCPLYADDIVIDPSAGSCNFLKEVGIRRRRPLINDEAEWRKALQKIKGFDIDPILVKLGKMSMILAGDGSGNIELRNTLLTDPKSIDWDNMWGNPPFFGDHEDGIVKQYDRTGWYPYESKQLAWYFLQWGVQGMLHQRSKGKSNIRLNLVLPREIIVSGGVPSKIRDWITTNKIHLASVVEHRDGTFKPHANCSTVMLSLRSNVPKNAVSVWVSLQRGDRVEGTTKESQDYYESSCALWKRPVNWYTHYSNEESKTYAIRELIDITKGKRGSGSLTTAEPGEREYPGYTAKLAQPDGSCDDYDAEGPGIILPKGGGSTSDRYGKRVGLCRPHLISANVKFAYSDGCFFLELTDLGRKVISLEWFYCWLINNVNVLRDLADAGTKGTFQLDEHHFGALRIALPTPQEQQDEVKQTFANMVAEKEQEIADLRQQEKKALEADLPSLEVEGFERISRKDFPAKRKEIQKKRRQSMAKKARGKKSVSVPVITADHRAAKNRGKK